MSRLAEWGSSGTLEYTQKDFQPELPQRERARHGSSFELDDRTAARVHPLIVEGHLRRACTALTSEPTSCGPFVGSCG